MSRLVDPTICPDCRAALDPAATCTACGLQVTGPLATQLWMRMVDGRPARRAAPRGAGPRREPSRPRAGAGARVGTAAPASRAPAAPGAPAAAAAAARPPRSRSCCSPSGALCLLVAAIVFVAVTWSLLGLTGRTLVLLGFTGVLAAGRRAC